MAREQRALASRCVFFEVSSVSVSTMFDGHFRRISDGRPPAHLRAGSTMACFAPPNGRAWGPESWLRGWPGCESWPPPASQLASPGEPHALRVLRRNAEGEVAGGYARGRDQTDQRYRRRGHGVRLRERSSARLDEMTPRRKLYILLGLVLVLLSVLGAKAFRAHQLREEYKRYRGVQRMQPGRGAGPALAGGLAGGPES